MNFTDEETNKKSTLKTPISW